MNENNPQQKEPVPDQEQTASSDTSITPYKPYTKERQEKRESIKERRKRQSWLSGRMLTNEYRLLLGPAIWLLLVIVRDCDWDTGVWRGTLWVVAEELGRGESTVQLWLKRVKKIPGVQSRQLSIEGTEVRLPRFLVPALEENRAFQPRQKNKKEKAEIAQSKDINPSRPATFEQPTSKNTYQASPITKELLDATKPENDDDPQFFAPSF
jgi:hypothetical protein